MAPPPLASVRIETDVDIVRLRQIASEIAGALEFRDFAKTRAVTAMLELARNAIEYAGGGKANLSVSSSDGVLTMNATVVDQGPGIKTIDEILAGKSVKSNGLGLGLYGVKRIADSFDITTGPEGTRIDVEFRSDLPAADLDKALSRVKGALSALETLDPAAALADQNRELLEAIASRDFLMKEIHHRTGNNLALISALINLSAAQASSDETKRILKDLKARVAAVTAAHQQLQRAQSGDNLSSSTFLQGIAESAADAFSGPHLDVKIRYRGDDLTIDGATAIDLGLMLNELITNAFKHAFTGRSNGAIDIQLWRADGGYRFIVSDDGVGLPDGADRPERSDSLGWRLIRQMASQYDGTIKTDGGDGFRVTIEFGQGLEAA